MRRSNSQRLANFDYSQAGGYFVTICVRGQRSLLGTLENDQVNLSPVGKVVDTCWRSIKGRYGQVEVDTFTVMPNHFHGILIIHGGRRGEAIESWHGTTDWNSPSNASPVRVTKGTKPGSLGAIIQNFKSISTRRINELRNTPGKSFWQRGYYDRIIRNRKELDRIRKYIIENPSKWELDEYHPSRITNRFN